MRFLTLMTCLLLSVPAWAEDAHPSFEQDDMMNPFATDRATHRDKLEAQSREWQEDWYSYSEGRYGATALPKPVEDGSETEAAAPEDGTEEPAQESPAPAEQ